MSLFGGLWGTKKKSSAPAPVSSASALEVLASQIDAIEKRQEYLEGRIRDETATIRAVAQTNRRRAIACLKRVQMYRAQIAQIEGTRDTLEMQQFALQSGVITAANLAALQAGVAAGRSVLKQVSVDQVDAVMDDVTEQMDDFAAINEAMSRPLMDGEDLDAELDAMLASAEAEAVPIEFPAIPSETRDPPLVTADDVEIERLIAQMNAA